MANTFKSINTIKVYEVDGEETVTVHAHWNRRSFVEIEVRGVKVTVIADDLIRAIHNAQNAHP